MAQSNQRYVTAENIMSRLAMEHKKKEFNIQEIVTWCAECTIEVIGNPMTMYSYNKVELRVVNDKALLPCNVYQLKDVFDVNDNRIQVYYNDGIHIIFNSEQTYDTNSVGDSVVYINYKGIPVDTKTGYPLIARGHEIACMAYCVWKLYYEDFLTGVLDGQRWGVINDNKIIQCSAANNGFRHHSSDDMKKILNVVHNIAQNASSIPMFHLDGVEQ